MLRGQIFHQGWPCICKSTHIQSSCLLLLTKGDFLENIWLTSPLLQVPMYKGLVHCAVTLQSRHGGLKGSLLKGFCMCLDGCLHSKCEHSSVPPALHTEKLHKATAVSELLSKNNKGDWDVSCCNHKIINYYSLSIKTYRWVICRHTFLLQIGITYICTAGISRMEPKIVKKPCRLQSEEKTNNQTNPRKPVFLLSI